MKRLKTILSKILNIEESIINDQTCPQNVENWDSFNGLMMVSEIEKNYKVKFTMKEVMAVKCVKDIKESLKSHGIKLQEE
jgi:acyl carrier protein